MEESILPMDQVKIHINDNNLANEVSFIVYSDARTGVYPKEKDCLCVNKHGNILATYNSGIYQIHNEHRIEQANQSNLVFSVYDKNNKEVLTLF